MDIEIPQATKDVIARANEVLGTDSNVVLVGGSVRDVLLGVAPKDYDFATSLLPDEVELRVRQAGKRAHTVGKRFGTIGFRYGGHFIEVTTYRSDVYTLGSRKPEVTFAKSLEQDLARRDFTINAMALATDYTLIDPFGGVQDLRTGIIRAVGKPQDRFQEDPLRMLRMLRFVARFGFAVDQATAEAARTYAYRLTTISTERISAELDGMIVAPHALDAFRRLAELELLSFAIPLLAVQVGYDQNTPYHRFTLWEHSLKTMAAVAPELELRWAALLHDIGKPFVRREKPNRSSYVHHDLLGGVLVEMIARYLKWSRPRMIQTRDLVIEHMNDASPIRSADNAAK
jgi:putative nucleotidyltransferase with HDIG domain